MFFRKMDMPLILLSKENKIGNKTKEDEEEITSDIAHFLMIYETYLGKTFCLLLIIGLPITKICVVCIKKQLKK